MIKCSINTSTQTNSLHPCKLGAASGAPTKCRPNHDFILLQSSRSAFPQYRQYPAFKFSITTSIGRPRGAAPTIIGPGAAWPAPTKNLSLPFMPANLPPLVSQFASYQLKKIIFSIKLRASSSDRRHVGALLAAPAFLPQKVRGKRALRCRAGLEVRKRCAGGMERKRKEAKHPLREMRR